MEKTKTMNTACASVVNSNIEQAEGWMDESKKSNRKLRKGDNLMKIWSQNRDKSIAFVYHHIEMCENALYGYIQMSECEKMFCENKFKCLNGMDG